MRFALVSSLTSLLALGPLGCTVRSEPDVPVADVPVRPDVPLADVPPLDAPRDVPAVLDVPAALDVPAELDVPAAPDVPAEVDAPIDAPTDVPVDAPVPPSDAGVAPPTIDGVITAGEWGAATVATDTTTTIWAGNELRGLRALLLPDALYLAVEGRIEGGNAIAVYVDRDRDEAVGVASLATLTDNSGALDAAITAGFGTPAPFRTDLVLGTLDLARAASGSDDRMGWRDLVRGAAGDLFWITAATAPVVCSATVCESRLPRSELGGTAPRRLGIFARIVNADGSMSPNQTLPSDDPSMPRTVSVVLELTE